MPANEATDAKPETAEDVLVLAFARRAHSPARNAFRSERVASKRLVCIGHAHAFTCTSIVELWMALQQVWNFN